MQHVSMEKGRALIVVVATLTLAACGHAPAQTDSDAFVLTATVTDVGELGEGLESDVVGPSAFYVGERGETVILDRVQRRLIITSADGADRLEIPLDDVFDGGVKDPLDLSIIDDRVFVLDVDGPKLSRRPYSSLLDPLSAAAEAAGAAPEADWDEAFRQFAATAWRGPEASAEESSGTEARCDEIDWDEASMRSWRDARKQPDSASIVEVVFQRRRDGSLSLSISSDGGRAVRMTPISPGGFIGSAMLAGVNKEGDAFVLVEHVAAEATLRVSPVVYKYDARGRLASKFDVPIGRARQMPFRYVVLGADGHVYHAQLVAGRTQRAARLIESAIADPRQLSLLAENEELTPSDPFRPIGPFESAGAPPSTTREGVMARAQSMTNFMWQITDLAYGPPAGESGECLKTQGAMWSRPAALRGRQGQRSTGLPYKWNGWDSEASFLTRSEAAGGDVCTCRDGALNYCAVENSRGIDCSGFITRAWFDTPTSKFGTWTLPEISDPIDIQDLKCGDILNKAGNHVVLFAGFSDQFGGMPEIYESSIYCSGVCRRVLPYAHLASYQARRRKNID